MLEDAIAALTKAVNTNSEKLDALIGGKAAPAAAAEAPARSRGRAAAPAPEKEAAPGRAPRAKAEAKEAAEEPSHEAATFLGAFMNEEGISKDEGDYREDFVKDMLAFLKVKTASAIPARYLASVKRWTEAFFDSEDGKVDFEKD